MTPRAGWRSLGEMKTKAPAKASPPALVKAPAKATRKLGDDRKETAVKARTLDKNFKQSKDIHEDRGKRQMKTGSAPRTSHGK